MQTGIIKFHHTELVTAKHNSKIYVAMKPIIEGIGLAWQSQSDKIKGDARYNDIVIPYKTNGGVQEMLSLPQDQLAAYLYSINPNKVAPHLRETIIAFQKETFNAINDYWNKGYAIKEDGSPLWLISKALETMLTQQASILMLLEQKLRDEPVVNREFIYIDKPTSRMNHHRLSNEEKFIAKVVKALENEEGITQGELLRRVGKIKADKTAINWLRGYDGIYWRANVLSGTTFSYSLIKEA